MAMAFASIISSKFSYSCAILKSQTKQLIRYSSYKSSQFLEDVETNRKYDITRDPDEWNSVERILPPTTVPEPIKKKSYPSGWKPSAVNLNHMSYYIERTKNHMLPVYLKLCARGTRRHTLVRKVKGDIFEMEKQLLKFLQKESFKPIRSQVNEFAGYIRMNGDFVNATKFWLEQKHF
ncbi:unnamed protein product [Phaedon cochleariae]|uniref:Large ribosomal subunit protein mL49 n=1 Tax=Phaedon cochleariae TaxID=80249 RepID=A0A9P0GU10_PHACE|nr:unnamed protein product [Phaedon cochleariae]